MKIMWPFTILARIPVCDYRRELVPSVYQLKLAFERTLVDSWPSRLASPHPHLSTFAPIFRHTPVHTSMVTRMVSAYTVNPSAVDKLSALLGRVLDMGLELSTPLPLLCDKPTLKGSLSGPTPFLYSAGLRSFR